MLCVVDRRIHGEPGLSTEELSTIETEDIGHDCVVDVTTMAAVRAPKVTVDGDDVRHGIPKDVILKYAGEIGQTAS